MSHPLPTRPPDQDVVQASLETIYRWSYEPEIDQLRTLYANALEHQWIAMRDLDWEQELDQEAFQRTFTMGGVPVYETRFWQQLPSETRWEVSRRSAAFMLSNFLHGEQGALLAAAQLVNAVPHMDGKYYASTQCVDEARHVEVFNAYIQKLDHVYPISPALKRILDNISEAPDWKKKAVGMQIVIEGLALYVFREMRNTTSEPLLKQILTYVSRDEARHTGYGIKYLSAVVPTLSDAEKAELEDFGFESARLLIDSRAGTTLREGALAIWQEVGLDPRDVFAALADERDVIARSIEKSGGRMGPLSGFVLPTMKSIGLFSDRIAGHFQDMFVAANGPQAKGLTERMRDLPEDLEAWVLEGA